MRNVITRSVGHGGESNPDVFSVDLAPGDIFMLCSDGLCGYVPDGEIAAVFTHYAPDVDQLAEKLVALALETGGEDNVTVVALRVE
jgi:serine/threonine protein phosphatase PrpC